MIIPGNGELEELQEANFPDYKNASSQDAIPDGESHIDPRPEAVVLAKPMAEPPGRKGAPRSQQPTQLLLFAYGS